MSQSITLGQQAEQLACDYLIHHDLTLLTRNYHCRRGEIDLIMQGGETLVFVEVRYRKSAAFGSALESVNYKKQQKIIVTAEHYISQQSSIFEQYRFDVIAIDSNLDLNDIVWVKEAFHLN